MVERTLEHIAFRDTWGRQMRFICGPRQSGKTTLAKAYLKKMSSSQLYYLWDSRRVRELYKQNELFFTADVPPKIKGKWWVCFDEIHKMPKWKNILKGVFDSVEDHYQFIITGSAKLNMFRRAGDSLAGRYFIFHLFPLMLKEIMGRPAMDEKETSTALSFVLAGMNRKPHPDQLENLLAFGGFPEPFIAQSQKLLSKWSMDYLDRVINEDIGLLTRIADREKLYDLYKLLPEFVASPLSENSLAGHLESNPVTIKNYLRRLEDFYLAFKVVPYTKNIKRALLRAGKWYLYDWTRIQNKTHRFENYVAVELNSCIYAWMDLTGTEYILTYIRDKEKRETDFLILKQGKPWLMIEVKYQDTRLESHHRRTSAQLGGIPVVQICQEHGIAVQEAKNIFRVSASRFFAS